MTARRLRRTILTALAFAGGLGAGLFAVSFPAIPAALCPPCVGLEKRAPGLYVAARADIDAQALAAEIAAARARIEPQLGPIARMPRILVCETPQCHVLLGGGTTHAMTYGARLVTLGPGGAAPEILAHELAHVALHARLGTRARFGFPAWLDEGIATYVSADPRFDLDPESCLAGDVETLPRAAPDWARAAGVDGTLYGRAGCAVAQWLDARPGAGLDDLVAAYSR